MIEEALLKSNYIGKDGFSWWIGQVAQKSSWEKGSQFSNKGDWAARCKVRIVGYHTFDGNILSDDDLPWAQIMLDPSFGSAQGGIGGTIHLTGGETCFGFFLDGDDGQQPVVIGLLYRSEGVKNLITEDVIAKERSSQFKPFTGNPNPPSTQRNARKDKEIDQTATTEERNNQETPPIDSETEEQLKLEGKDITQIAFSTDLGLNIAGVKVDKQVGDKIVGLFEDNASASTQAILKAVGDRPAFIKPNGCENNLIGQITQGLQDFIAVTNGLDQYIGVYIDPVLNEIVDIGNSIKDCARQIGGIIKLIINNLRNTIFKCIGWAFRKLVGPQPYPQQKIVLEVMKRILDIIFCILEKLPGDLLGFLEGLLGDLAANTINAPVCAVEQWTAGILAKVMDSIEKALSTIMSGIGWLTGGLSTVSGILNQASSLAAQIFSFLECTGLACETPSVWAANFGPSEKEADDWQKTVDSVNVFKGVSKGLGSIDEALQVTPLYAGINGRFANIFDKCNQKVINPTSQNDIIPLPIGSKYSNCLPPIVRIVGVGIGAKAKAIVGNNGSIFSVEVISGGVGYTKKPTVTIVDNTGHGSKAKAKAIVSAAGTVSSIYLTDVGSGYCKGDSIDKPECSIDADCPPGYICENGFCIPDNLCTFDSDCPEGYVCENGVCVPNKNCSANECCAPGYTCKDGECKPNENCSIDSDCPKGYICLNGKCVPAKRCSIDSDCPSGYICDNGICVPEKTCSIDSDCPEGYVCRNGVCVLEKTCSIDSDCPEGYVCRNGVCVPESDSGFTTSITGCVNGIIVISPGYGYTSGDTISDGKNTYTPIVSPRSGAIVKVEIPTNIDLCGFDAAPNLTINTSTGVAAELIPNMKYKPTFNKTRQQTAVSGIITSVVDCV